MSSPAGIVAVDLGSNSFHMVIARLAFGEPMIEDRIREQVQLAAGLGEDRRLHPEAVARALACLERFANRLRNLPDYRVRAIGTNTFRVAVDAEQFLDRAQQALGSEIEVVSGTEEARLIYLGVSHGLVMSGGSTALVVDIGGGSTEVILGRGYEVLHAYSLDMGCVGFSQRYFPDGGLSGRRFKAALVAAEAELQPVRRLVRDHGWDLAIGASGTVRAIERILAANGWCERGIDTGGLRKLRRAILDAGKVERLSLPGLDAERAGVLAGGLVILWALVKTFAIDKMTVASGSLREGVVFDMLGRLRHEDARERTIRAFQERYRIDLAQAGRVERTVERLWQKLSGPWSLDRGDSHDLVRWAASLHEIGLAVSWRHQHRHGRYLLAHSDMPGFSRNDQQMLATLVGAHRRRVDLGNVALPPRHRDLLERLVAILRIAVVLNRARPTLPPLPVAASADGNAVTLRFAATFPSRHPLTAADLEAEKSYLRGLGIELRIEFAPARAAQD